MTAHPDCPWTGGCHCERDAAACACGHRNVSHGSFVRAEFVGVGMGVCGFCDCSGFSPRLSQQVFDLEALA